MENQLVSHLENLSEYMGERLDLLNNKTMSILGEVVKIYNAHLDTFRRGKLSQIIMNRVGNEFYPPKTVGYFLQNCLMDKTLSGGVKSCDECNIERPFSGTPINTVVNYYGNGKYRVREGSDGKTLTIFVEDINEKHFPTHILNEFSDKGFETVNIIVRRGGKYFDSGFLQIVRDRKIEIPEGIDDTETYNRINNNWGVFVLFIFVILSLLFIALIINMGRRNGSSNRHQ